MLGMDQVLPSEILAMTDFEAAQRLADHRWPDGMSCSRCGSTSFSHLRCRPREFACSRCNRRVSVTAGTLLHRSGVPLFVWFAAAHLVARPEGVSAATFRRLTGLSRYETAWRVLHRVRAALALFTLPVPKEAPVGCAAMCPRGERPREYCGRRIDVAAARVDERLVIDLARRADLKVAIADHPLDEELRYQLCLVDLHLMWVHHRVSPRWFRRYLAEGAYRLDRRPVTECLHGVIAGAIVPWRAVRPPIGAGGVTQARLRGHPG